MWLRASYTVENAVITPLFMLIIIVVMLLAVEFILLRHGKFLRCNEVEGRVEVAHGGDK